MFFSSFRRHFGGRPSLLVSLSLGDLMMQSRDHTLAERLHQRNSFISPQTGHFLPENFSYLHSCQEIRQEEGYLWILDTPYSISSGIGGRFHCCLVGSQAMRVQNNQEVGCYEKKLAWWQPEKNLYFMDSLGIYYISAGWVSIQLKYSVKPHVSKAMPLEQPKSINHHP